MTISICMGIYNGERFIERQLQSILRQTRQPDEVILCDDVSTDGTIHIVRQFIEENHLEKSWKIYQNEENLGYPANFYHAMTFCKNEIVFLADQDDIWHEQKLERMVKFFEEDDQVKAVSCKFDLIDEEDHKIHTVMNPAKSKKDGGSRKVTVSDIFYKCEWPGMVMAYRRDWYEAWTKNSYSVPHDFLICARAAEESGFVQTDDCLAYHRRHGNNTGGEEHRIRKLLNRERKLDEIRKYLAILEAFQKENVMKTADGQEQLCKKKNSMNGRYEALLSGKLGKVITNAWRFRGDMRLATVLCDVGITVLR